MSHRSQLWFLLPHGISAVCFGLAFVWLFHAGTNRTMPDLYLAIAGFVALAAAAVATVVGVVVAVRVGAGRFWPWILVHPAALAVVLVIAGSWIGAHLA